MQGCPHWTQSAFDEALVTSTEKNPPRERMPVISLLPAQIQGSKSDDKRDLSTLFRTLARKNPDLVQAILEDLEHQNGELHGTETIYRSGTAISLEEILVDLDTSDECPPHKKKSVGRREEAFSAKSSSCSKASSLLGGTMNAINSFGDRETPRDLDRVEVTATETRLRQAMTEEQKVGFEVPEVVPEPQLFEILKDRINDEVCSGQGIMQKEKASLISRAGVLLIKALHRVRESRTNKKVTVGRQLPEDETRGTTNSHLNVKWVNQKARLKRWSVKTILPSTRKHRKHIQQQNPTVNEHQQLQNAYDLPALLSSSLHETSSGDGGGREKISTSGGCIESNEGSNEVACWAIKTQACIAEEMTINLQGVTAGCSDANGTPGFVSFDKNRTNDSSFSTIGRCSTSTTTTALSDIPDDTLTDAAEDSLFSDATSTDDSSTDPDGEVESVVEPAVASCETQRESFYSRDPNEGDAVSQSFTEVGTDDSGSYESSSSDDSDSIEPEGPLQILIGSISSALSNKKGENTRRSRRLTERETDWSCQQ